MSLARAIEQLQAEIDLYAQGTPQAPKDGSDDWFVLRAKAVGLTFLKRLEQLKLEANPSASERFFRRHSNGIKASEAEE